MAAELPSVDTSPSDSHEVSVVNASIQEIYERGKVDINFFASLCIPDVCIYSLPVFYLACFQLLIHRDPSQIGQLLRFALGLPRGHAKTTFIKILICWMIVYDHAKFVLIVCANSELAELLLADIHDILCSDNITAVYGNWEQGLSIDSAHTKKSQYHSRPVSLVARGWKGGIRGINLKHQRPDVIFCDDAQTRDNSESLVDSATLLATLVGTIFKAIAPYGNRLIIYVGNMYSDSCVLNKLRKSPSWYSMVTGAILSDGQPLWAELHSLKDLMESYYHDESLGMSHIWFAEVMNDPTNSAQSIFPNPLPDSPIMEDSELEMADGSFITIDPAGFRKNSDDNVITVHLKYGENGFIVESLKGILDPEQIIISALALATKWRCSLIGVEDTGYQMTLAFWFNKYIAQYGITGLSVVPLKPHGRSKEARIRLFIAELYKLNYFIHDPQTRRDFTWQASTYKMGKTDNKDDLLDAAAYGLDVRNEYWDRITLLDHGFIIDGECRVVSDNTPF
jgi:hypothetical protein